MERALVTNERVWNFGDAHSLGDMRATYTKNSPNPQPLFRAVNDGISLLGYFRSPISSSHYIIVFLTAKSPATFQYFRGRLISAPTPLAWALNLGVEFLKPTPLERPTCRTSEDTPRSDVSVGCFPFPTTMYCHLECPCLVVQYH